MKNVVVDSQTDINPKKGERKPRSPKKPPTVNECYDQAIKMSLTDIVDLIRQLKQRVGHLNDSAQKLAVETAELTKGI